MPKQTPAGSHVRSRSLKPQRVVLATNHIILPLNRTTMVLPSVSMFLAGHDARSSSTIPETEAGTTPEPGSHSGSRASSPDMSIVGPPYTQRAHTEGPASPMHRLPTSPLAMGQSSPLAAGSSMSSSLAAVSGSRESSAVRTLPNSRVGSEESVVPRKRGADELAQDAKNVAQKMKLTEESTRNLVKFAKVTIELLSDKMN